MMLSFSRGAQPDWTSADFDSYQILAAAGLSRPAARVTRARAPRTGRRTARRTVRAVLRRITDRCHTGPARPATARPTR